MARHTFGEPISDDDVLVIQGVEYPMIPVGMRAMRRMLNLSKKSNIKPEDGLTDENLAVAIDIIAASVHEDHREKLLHHIEESVGPNLLVEIASAVMASFSDLDPTQQESSSPGSTPTGPASAGGALPAPSISTT